MLYKGHRFFTKDVNFIRPYFKDFGWANFWALTASIAFVRIDGDIPVAGPIPKTIIGNHVICLSFPPHPIPLLSEAEALPSRRPPGERGIRGLGFSCALCLTHFQQSVSKEGCSDATGELSVKRIFAIDILFLVPDTLSGFYT